jgi:2-keto-4-pentenoate hydratase/2-oxohepta-3-ene-1,7-dioic acid hydratase in catechol pathway
LGDDDESRVKIARVRDATSGEIVFVEDDGGARLVGIDAPLPGGAGALGRTFARADVVVLAPLVPGKIVCVGRNYAAHAKELGNTVPEEPVLFLKPPSSVLDPGAPIVRPVHMSSLVHHEGELAIVVGRSLSHASADEARAAVWGYTIANDVTARDVQRREGVFGRAKGFDTFCPLGPVVVSADEILEPQDLSLRVLVNDEVRQHASTRAMVFPIARLLAFISRVMSLARGDVVLTGTPEGVGPLVAGDTVVVEVESIGRLENRVVDGPARAPW